MTQVHAHTHDVFQLYQALKVNSKHKFRSSVFLLFMPPRPGIDHNQPALQINFLTTVVKVMRTVFVFLFMITLHYTYIWGRFTFLETRENTILCIFQLKLNCLATVFLLLLVPHCLVCILQAWFVLFPLQVFLSIFIMPQG